MKARVTRRGIRLLLLVLLFLTVVPPLRAQESTSDPVFNLMDQMSPEAKVGQLVLVSFPGTDVGDASEIATLIRDFWIGGVLLGPENGNFNGVSSSDVVSMTTALQTAARDAAASDDLSDVGETSMPYQPPYVPLFVAVGTGDGGLVPTTFIPGTSALPTPLALGATWAPALSQAVGAVLGEELATLGFNFYLGPDLDVLYTPRPGDAADLGTQVFGGDPFWVGQMGTAYIQGLHEGSQARLLVAPRHLPGLGSADRPLADEIPTVQKPLEQLKQIELAPFFAAAQELPGSAPAADAFVVTHIKYRGFQGNIRQTTKPISLDPQALQLVTGLEEVAPWHEAGGLLVADNLGLPSIQRLYDPRGVTSIGRRVAQDALSAGNDLLVLDRFVTDEVWSVHFANIRDTLKFLAAQYKDDLAFKAVVDDAVYRILSAKMRLYPEFALDRVLVDPEVTEATLGGANLVNAQVAVNALTLIYPQSEDFLPTPPQEGESMVIFTQEQAVALGDEAEALPLLENTAIPETVMRFYGPDGTGIVRFNAVQAFTFEDLMVALEVGPQAVSEATTDDGTPEPTVSLAANVFNALQRAQWIIFATTGLNAGDSEAFALERFLAEEANLLDGRIAVLTFGPPYELDSTEISKLDLYYGLFSPGGAFVEAGVRALFGGLPAPGASPVDMPALNYSVPKQTMPDPDQLISLYVVDDAGHELTPTARSNIHIGDLLNLRTGALVDRNGHIVPDGTPVQFVLNYPQEDIQRNVVAETQDGGAETAIQLNRVGQLDITVQSEPAVSSVRLELAIRDDGVTISEVEPTATPTLEPTPTLTVTPSPTATPNPVSSKADDLPDHLQLPAPERGKLIRWGLVGTVLVFALGFMWAREQSLPADRATMMSLFGTIGALVSYMLLMILSRWWMPVVQYALVGREFLAGVVTGGMGGVTLMMALWVANEQTVRQGDHEGLSSRYPKGERYSRSRP